MPTNPSDHWETVYRTKNADTVSWYRPRLDVSLQLLDGAGMSPEARVIDIGGGASTLVDDLLAHGVTKITVLDLSDQALQRARSRLGTRAAIIDWRVADVTTAEFPSAAYDLWHDRAVLHFLTTDAETSAYCHQACTAVRAGGHLVIGGFASDGPEQCSGLRVARREPADIAALFKTHFDLVDQAHEIHQTPWGTPQHFAYAVLRRR